MKNILLVACACIITVTGSAQVSIGAFAAITADNYTEVYDEANIEYYTSVPGGLGVIADIGMAKNISLRPSAQLKSYYDDTRMIDVKCNATYSLHVGDKSLFFLSAGPYVDITVRKYSYISPTTPVVSPFNFGGSGSVGFQYIGVFFALQYQQQVSNAASKERIDMYGKDYELRYNSYGLVVGYIHNFSKKEKYNKPVKKNTTQKK